MHTHATDLSKLAQEKSTEGHALSKTRKEIDPQDIPNPNEQHLKVENYGQLNKKVPSQDKTAGLQKASSNKSNKSDTASNNNNLVSSSQQLKSETNNSDSSHLQTAMNKQIEKDIYEPEVLSDRIPTPNIERAEDTSMKIEDITNPEFVEKYKQEILSAGHDIRD